MSVRVYGNRQIKTRTGSLTRPTAAKVRSALFNIWQGRVEGCRWLDLCAGSGAIGAEALGRGASVVVGIEQDSRACAVIRQNWQQIAQPNQQFRLVRGDVLQRLRELGSTSNSLPFDCIYFDPPYASHLYKPVLAMIAHYQLLAADGELAVEHATPREGTGAIASPPGLMLCRQKHYGTTSLSFFVPIQDKVQGEKHTSEESDGATH